HTTSCISIRCCALLTLSQRSYLFPYTTLFRSLNNPDLVGCGCWFMMPILFFKGGFMKSTVLVLLSLFCLSSFANTITQVRVPLRDRKSTRLNSSHVKISYAVFCLKKKTRQHYK